MNFARRRRTISLPPADFIRPVEPSVQAPTSAQQSVQNVQATNVPQNDTVRSVDSRGSVWRANPERLKARESDPQLGKNFSGASRSAPSSPNLRRFV